MVIAVPTGIKIFSWLSYSLSKSQVTNTLKKIFLFSYSFSSIVKENIQVIKSSQISLYDRFPRANRKYIKENNLIKSLVPFGINLSSTVGYPTYGIILQQMVNLPPYIKNIIVGLLLSDGWMQKQNLRGQTRLCLKQSLVRSEYLLFVFFLLKHYCKSYPKIGYAKLNGKIFPFLYFSSRSLFCFTEIYSMFYVEGTKRVPENIFELLNIEGLAHWICGDGSYVKGGGLYLNTQSFSISDNLRLIEVLSLKFSCKCKIHMQRNLPVIYISARSMNKLVPILTPYFPKGMRYKIINTKSAT
jgi:heme/copper-type cytochrome/quinol oxidase subunit 1